MNQLKIGTFISALRKGKNMTQEQLGKKLGVTNKTISRWECGNYMPDIEMLALLSKEFEVSINELLAGERLSGADFRAKADENIIALAKSSAFSFEEQRRWLIKKWRREHIAFFILLFVIALSVLVLPIIFGKPWLGGLFPLVCVIEYGYQNNKMMIYVENHLYSN